jgi:phosphatidylserine decarboxylase
MSSDFTTYAAAQVLKLVPRVQLSRAVGRLCDLQVSPTISRVATKIYARAYGVNIGEAEPTPSAYRSFDEFFTRGLRPGARPIAQVPIVSPSDGKIVAAGAVTDEQEIVVKGNSYEVSELCGSAEVGKRYNGGEFMVIYLHPRDYHRVHSPVDGAVVSVRSMPGDLFPVNAIGEKHVPKLFVRNQRVAIGIETPTMGLVTAVMVGATIVGRISTTVLGGDSTPVGEHIVEPPVTVVKGDEIGVFHLGSTVVLLTEGRGRLSWANGPVRYGESVVKG